jgi:NAD(P)H-flavin reductase/ferredoxin
MAKVKLEPIGEEIDCDRGETVLDAAFRQGLNLAYGCREGQCSACKCFLLEGDVELKRYSNFALSDTERDNGYSLMCRAMPESDLTIELLHFDPESYRLDHPIRDGKATIETVESLTSDISRVVAKVNEPADFTFTPGQYIDLHVPGEDGARRSFSLANVPGDGRLELMIKRYPGGRVSGLLEAGEIKPGQEFGFTGPYGSMRARAGEAPVLMIAGGSGMAPILSLLRAYAAEQTSRPIHFFYGARSEQDLFHQDEIAAIGKHLQQFTFTPVTDRFVHETVDEFLTQGAFAGPDVYMCGPPPMLEAAEEMLLSKHKLNEQRIFQDKFTTSADAGGASSAGEAAAPPIKKIGESSLEPSDDAMREFDWFTPRKRRASLYEDVTIDTQPSVHRHLPRGWPVSFEDGRGTWDDGSTALKSTDWFAFRDPGEQWERTYYQAGSAYENQIEGAIKAAIEEGLVSDFSPAWVDFLKSFLQIPAFVEHGLWLPLAVSARDGLSDSISHCMVLQAAMKQRSAQALVLYAMDLEAFHGEFSIDLNRRAFLEDPEWQPTRAYLEKLAATADWCEVLVAANLVFEPTLGTLLRRELGIRAASHNGDTVTPTLARVATQEWEWTRAYTTELVRMLIADEQHGAANREQISDWIKDWLPQALIAAQALMPLAQRVPIGIDVERAITDVTRYTAVLFAEAGLGELGSLIGIELETPPADTGLTGPVSAPTRRTRTGKARRSKVAEIETEAAAVEPDEGGESYDFVGIVMAKSAEGDAVADVMRRRDGVTVIEQAAFWDVRAKDKLVISYDEVSEQLGYEIDSYSIQHEMSTHYGRMVATDDSLMLFSDPTEALQYLMA